MPLPYRLTKPLVQLWCAARAICAEIEQYEPEVIVALYHGVQPLLRAVETVWAEGHGAARPFPPVARINFGTEKDGRYTPVPKRLNTQYFIGLYEGPLARGHFLLWLSGQRDWLDALRGQVEAVLGRVEPQRILVLDDMTYEGNSSLGVLGLLHALYPRARLEYTEGFASGWLVEFAYFWLETHHPGTVQKMDDDWPRQVQASGHLHYEHFLRRLLLGTEDVAEEPLAWRPVGPGGWALAYISNYLPAETWLALPTWFYSTLEVTMRRWTRAGRPPVRFKCPPRPPSDVQLAPRDLIGRAFWMRRLTVAEAVSLSGATPDEAEQMLERCIEPGFIERTEEDGTRVYVMRSQVGILALGALRYNPGTEIAAMIERRLPAVAVPFEVEYARLHRARGSRPMLAPVPQGQGRRVRADVLVLKPDVNVKTARDLLYRRMVRRVGDMDIRYDETVQFGAHWVVRVRELPGFAGLPVVLYTDLPPGLRVVRPHRRRAARRRRLRGRLSPR